MCSFSIGRLDPLEGSERRVCIQELVWGMLSGSIPTKVPGTQDWEEGGVELNVVLIKALANPQQ
jgi:hypothetical protein